MSIVRFCSDLHFGHKKITSFTDGLRTGECHVENATNIIRNWNSVVRKRDTTWVLGDVAFTREGLEWLGELAGQKRLILGNHDEYPLEEYFKYFDTIHSLVRYKEYWLSHAPIHPAELRGNLNIHGHVHQKSIRDGYSQRDQRYINVSMEAINETPVTLDAIRSGKYWEDTKC